MRTRTRIILGVVVVTAIGGGALVARARKPPAPEVTSEAVQRGTLTATVVETGSVESPTEVRVGVLATGRVDRRIARNGDVVRQGDPLLAIESASQAARFKQAQAQLDRARAALALLERGAKPEEVAAQEQAVRNAEAAVAKARTVRDATAASAARDVAAADAALRSASSRETTASGRPQDVAASVEADVATLREQLAAAEEKVARTRDQRDVRIRLIDARNDAAEVAEQSAAAELARAQIARSTCAMATCTPEEIAALDAAVAKAVAQLESAEAAVETTAASGELEREQADDLLASALDARDLLQRQLSAVEAKGASTQNDASSAAAQAGVDRAAQQASTSAQKAAAELRRASAESSLAQAEAQLASARAQLALVSRQVTDIDLAAARADVAAAEAAVADARFALSLTTVVAPADGTVTQLDVLAGEVVSPGQVLARITDTSTLRVTVNVSETEVARVAVGMPAELTFDALDPSTVVGATVGEIEASPTVVQGVVFYRTRLELPRDEATALLRPGMTATVTITTLTAEGVLTVPSRAVSTRDGARTVTVVLPDGSLEERTVTTGRRGDEGVEVLSGLSEGDEVVTARKTSLLSP